MTILLSVTDEVAVCLAQYGDDIAVGEIDDVSIGKNSCRDG